MHALITRSGKIRIRAGKLQFVNKISLGECIAIFVDTLILAAIFIVA